MNQSPFFTTTKPREANLRQRLLKASRAVNTAIVEGLQQRGFKQLRSTHTALLSNLDLDGSNITSIAQRAGMTKQAMGRLADELIKHHYIESTPDPADKRSLKLTFSYAGLELMQQSFTVMSELEKHCAQGIGLDRFNTALNVLKEIVNELEQLRVN